MESPRLVPKSQTDRFTRALPLALLPALFGLLLVCWLPVERAAGALAYPYQMDREEGFVLGQALSMSRGESIYQPIDEPPYLVGNYAPVYPAIYAVFLAATGPSLIPGRVLVLLSALIVIASLGFIVARSSKQIMPVALAVVLFASSWEVNEWLPFVRVDFPAMAFGLAAMAALVWMKRGGWAVAGVLFALSVLTKQTMLAAPAAALLGLLWCGRWREGALMTAAAIVPWGLVTLVMQVVTGGEYFRHTVIYNVNVFHWGDLLTWWNHLLTFSLWKLVATLAALLVLLAAYLLPRQSESAESRASGARLVIPMSVAYLAFSTLSALGIAKVGSAPNYLLELHAACAMVIAIGIGEIARGALRPKATAPMGIVLIALVSFHWIAIALWPAVQFGDGTSAARTGFYNRAPGVQDRELGTFVRMRVADTRGHILCEEPIFQILEGRELWFEPFIMTQLAKEQHWDEGDFVEMLRDGHFALLVLARDVRDEDQHFPAFTPAMRRAIREAYEFEQVMGGRYWIFVPKRDDSEREVIIANHSMHTEKRWHVRHWRIASLPIPDVAKRDDPVGGVIG